MSYTNTYRILSWGSAVSFILAIAFFYLAEQKKDHGPAVATLQTLLETSLQQDKVHLQAYFRHSSGVIVSRRDSVVYIEEKLNASPFLIEIWQKDTLLFWNDHSVREEVLPYNPLIEQVQSGELLAKISWAGFRSTQALQKYAYIHPTGPGQTASHRIQVGKWNLSIQSIESPACRNYQIATWFFLLSGFCLFSLWLLQQWLIKNRFIFLVAAGGWLLGGKFFFYTAGISSWWTGFFMMDELFVHAVITPNLTQFYINLWIAGCIIFTLAIRPEWIKKGFRLLGAGNAALLTGIYTFLAFGLSLQGIRSFVLHPDVRLDSETLMQFDTSGLGFVFLLHVAMLLVFQSTHMLQERLIGSAISFSGRLLRQVAGWFGGAGLMLFSDLPSISLWILLLFVAAYSLMLDAYCESKEKKVSYLIWWLMLFSGFQAVAIFYFGLEKDVASRKEFPALLLTDADKNIVADLKALEKELTSRQLFNTISSLDFAAKFDRDDLFEFLFKQSPGSPALAGRSIELFDKKSGVTLFHHHFADFYRLRQAIDQSRPLGSNLYYNPVEDRYFLRFEIFKEATSDQDATYPDSDSWYLFIIQEGRQPISYKEKQGRYPFGYACYSKGKLMFKAENGENYPDADLLASIDTTSVRQGYSFVVTHLFDQYKIVSWKKISGLLKPISIFSYLFTLSGLLLILLAFINTRIGFLPASIAMRFGDKSSLKTRIQLAVIALILVTFLVIGAITAFYFHNLIQAGQKSESANESTIIANHIQSDIQHFADEEGAISYLRSRLKDLSFIHEKELSLYDSRGLITGSTRRAELRWLAPYALVHAAADGSISSLSIEKEATDFVPLSIGGSKPFAFIAIHHLVSGSTSGSILNFLSTILNAYIFLFLIAGAIAITISNSITQPLTILAEKLKKFKLGRSNEMLEWNSQDEIGTLISDYNNLTRELERSAGLLAKTERDLAWREMAKQVAHEIKNPLTPMKLSIQYLDRAAKEQPEKAQEMIPKISSTLIEQIDNLSQIASEFSNFATMPQATNEKVILNEIVETIHDLFRKRDDMDINMIEPIDDLTVFADKNHLVRILNNLLKNAIQAIPESRRGKIEIELKRENTDALIRISDNGTGIPDHMKEKVFTPNFTTKNSGTGLGLAISANMIESFNGKIYFETRVGSGTDFFVRIPLMRLDDYREEGNRVTLD